MLSEGFVSSSSISCFCSSSVPQCVHVALLTRPLLRASSACLPLPCCRRSVLWCLLASAFPWRPVRFPARVRACLFGGVPAVLVGWRVGGRAGGHVACLSVLLRGALLGQFLRLLLRTCALMDRSVRRSVGRSFGRSVGRSVGPSVDRSVGRSVEWSTHGYQCASWVPSFPAWRLLLAECPSALASLLDGCWAARLAFSGLAGSFACPVVDDLLAGLPPLDCCLFRWLAC